MLNSAIPAKDGSGRIGVELYAADAAVPDLLGHGAENLTFKDTLVLPEIVWGHKGG
jgi:hypothetical protein